MSNLIIIRIAQTDEGLRLVAVTAADADAIRDDSAAIDGITPLGAIDAWPRENGRGWYWEWAVLPRTGAARAELLRAVEELQEQ